MQQGVRPQEGQEKNEVTAPVRAAAEKLFDKLQPNQEYEVPWPGHEGFQVGVSKFRDMGKDVMTVSTEKDGRPVARLLMFRNVEGNFIIRIQQLSRENPSFHRHFYLSLEALEKQLGQPVAHGSNVTYPDPPQLLANAKALLRIAETYFGKKEAEVRGLRLASRVETLNALGQLTEGDIAAIEEILDQVEAR